MFLTLPNEKKWIQPPVSGGSGRREVSLHALGGASKVKRGVSSILRDNAGLRRMIASTIPGILPLPRLRKTDSIRTKWPLFYRIFRRDILGKFRRNFVDAVKDVMVGLGDHNATEMKFIGTPPQPV